MDSSEASKGDGNEATGLAGRVSLTAQEAKPEAHAARSADSEGPRMSHAQRREMRSRLAADLERLYAQQREEEFRAAHADPLLGA